MPNEQSGLWNYLDKWKKIFKEKRPLHWRGSWLDNAWCGECRFCCGPQGTDKPFPMPLLDSQMQPGYKEHFYFLNDSTAYLAEKGCRSDSVNGCVLKREERPVACGLFPIVMANGHLYLYLNCPAALFVPLAWFYETAMEIANWLLGFSLEDLRHLSLELDCDTLSKKYVDLHIQIFNDAGKSKPFKLEK